MHFWDHSKCCISTDFINTIVHSSKMRFSSLLHSGKLHVSCPWAVIGVKRPWGQTDTHSQLGQVQEKGKMISSTLVCNRFTLYKLWNNFIPPLRISFHMRYDFFKFLRQFLYMQNDFLSKGMQLFRANSFLITSYFG